MTAPNALSLTRRGSMGLALGALMGAPAFAKGSAGFAGVDAAASALVEKGLTPGVSVSIMRSGALIYSRGFGLADIETQTPVTPQSVFKIGSITKQFTAAAILLLQEDGKLSLDDTFAKFYPEFPRASEITLRRMLNHTSGLGNYTAVEPRSAFFQEARLDYSSQSLFALMEKTSPPLYLYEPGTDWAYSNTAFVLLGLLVEKLSGAPYAHVFKERLFQPAGLMDTAVDDAAEVVPKRVSGYSGHEGQKSHWDNASFISMTFPGAAGALRSTSEDLCRWHLALFGGKILKASSLKAMTTPGVLKNGAPPMGSLGPGPKKPTDYMLGLYGEMIDGRHSIGHAGGINGFTSDVRSFPEEKVSFSVLVNTDGSGPDGIGEGIETVKTAAAKAAI
jgi:CubicO group peptidase (beta-lactamase class C family)